ncbi:MAG: hypothetical protein SOW20_08165 [Berryella intestinalis]|uniref:hypothetical protein n=1 Tax=Berryella intestinalis TaxID=1531429 RepID=UPI002A75FF11|nr:hypothetical protein [Berryella intestinalis]MDY3129978.1 hypothetical protein [Berryella intestinalis]
MGAKDIVERVKVRFIEGEEIPPDEVIHEFVSALSDRLSIRLRAQSLPKAAESIVADAAMKAIRRRGFEGSSSESSGDGGSISNSFITNVLDEYEREIAELYRTLNGSGIRFFR